MLKQVLCATAVAISLVRAQDAPKPPAFLAADVHVTPADYRDISPGTIRDNQFDLRGMTMLSIITRAYGMEADRILGGPRRMEFDKYDIIAKVSPGTKNDAIPLMLKSVLEERFHLVAREEKRQMTSFALTLGKGKHKLKPAEGSETRCSTVPGASAAQAGGPQMMHLVCKAYTTTMLANSILRSLGSGFITGPVADQTGLQGNWDIDLEFAPPALNGGSGASMMDAIENQLGLKLEQKSADQPVIVIESINSVPTPNVPGVAGMMAPPLAPMEVEVATIKPSAPGSPQGGMRFATAPQGGGMQFEARGMRLSSLITQMWGLPAERVVGLPPGIDDQLFDFVVKFTGTAGPSMNGTLGPGIQSLLKERFKFAGHLEDRPMDAYKLVAVKPKMAKADPENRASCKSGPAPGAKDPRDVTPGRTLLYTCRNVTMAEFAERLQGLSGGFLRMPVTDATKLEGMWDFTLNFSPQTQTAIVSTGTGGALVTTQATPAVAGGGVAGAGVTPLAGDPSDNITFLEALSSQLGLKLELEKRPMPVLVIEHLEKAPTEN